MTSSKSWIRRRQTISTVSTGCTARRDLPINYVSHTQQLPRRMRKFVRTTELRRQRFERLSSHQVCVRVWALPSSLWLTDCIVLGHKPRQCRGLRWAAAHGLEITPRWVRKSRRPVTAWAVGSARFKFKPSPYNRCWHWQVVWVQNKPTYRLTSNAAIMRPTLKCLINFEEDLIQYFYFICASM